MPISKSSMGAIPHSMAKNHGRARRRRAFNLRKVRVAAALTIGNLAANDVISAVLTVGATDPYRLMSVNFTYNIINLGSGNDDGQEFGLAHSDYTAAEIEECLESQTAIDRGDKIALEQSNRLVRTIGTFVGTPVANAGRSFNDGRMMKTKLNWYMATGDQLALWVRNGSGTVYTTGAGLSVIGNIWLKDSV